MVDLRKHLDLLGYRVKDRISGFTGVVASVCFDLYGCIQAVVNPGIDKDGKPRESHWFDVNRLEILGSEPVMERPEFDWSPEAVARGEKGPAERPSAARV